MQNMNESKEILAGVDSVLPLLDTGRLRRLYSPCLPNFICCLQGVFVAKTEPRGKL